MFILQLTKHTMTSPGPSSSGLDTFSSIPSFVKTQ